MRSPYESLALVSSILTERYFLSSFITLTVGGAQALLTRVGRHGDVAQGSAMNQPAESAMRCARTAL
jgi:hypothetical protein